MRKPITLLSLAAVVTLSVAASVNEPFLKPQNQNTATLITGAVINKSEQAAAKGNNQLDNTVPAASYTSPNFFKLGISESGDRYNKTNLFGPCYTDLTWTNTSTNATSVKWSYDTNTKYINKTVENSDSKLVLNYKYCITTAPKITATANGKDSTYYYGDNILCGGNTEINGIEYGACTYDLGHTTGDVISKILGYPEGDAYWLDGTSYTSVKIMTFGNLFPQPAAPYTMSRCWVRYYGIAKAGASFTMCLHKVNTEGKIVSDTLAIGTATLADDVNSETAGKSFALSFNMKYKDTSLGTGDLTIDTPIYLELSGFRNDKVTSFQPMWRSGVYSYTDADKHAVVGLECVKDGVTSYSYPKATYFKFGDAEPYMYCTDFEFQTNAVFSTTPTGVNEISASATAPKVTVNNGNFVISASDAVNEVSIYNASGVMEAKASLHGETTVDAQSLPHGIFVLRFSNGATAKIEK